MKTGWEKTHRELACLAVISIPPLSTCGNGIGASSAERPSTPGAAHSGLPLFGARHEVTQGLFAILDADGTVLLLDPDCHGFSAALTRVRGKESTWVVSSLSFFSQDCRLAHQPPIC